jgi:hypothetical protein
LVLRPILLSFFLAAVGYSQAPSPDSAQQGAMLAAMARYAEKYISGLPNFLCELTTEQYRSGVRHLRWKRGDTLTAQLAFSNGQEKSILKAVNDKPLKASSPRRHRPLTTSGEFGSILADAFADSSNARFRWNRWDTIQGKRVAVFDYAIDKEHSFLRLSRSDLASAIVPYHGSVYGDPDSGAIYRVSNEATEIPADIKIVSITTTVDYVETTIGAGRYLLPSHATVFDNRGFDLVRNELYFRSYRKFEAESSIKFESNESENTSH